MDRDDAVPARVRHTLAAERPVSRVPDADAALDAVDWRVAVVVLGAEAAGWSAGSARDLRERWPHCRIAATEDSTTGDATASDGPTARPNGGSGDDVDAVLPSDSETFGTSLEALARRAEYCAITGELFNSIAADENEDGRTAAGSDEVVALRRRAAELADEFGEDDYRALFSQLDVGDEADVGALDA